MKNKIIFKTLMLKGEAGSTIVSMEKTGHVGTADIYTITFNDGSTTEISLENMSAITSVEKTSSTDTEDIYTITCADGSTQTFSVLNHNSDIAAMSDDIDTIDARVDNFINSVVPNTVETLWTGSIKDVGDSATLSKAVSNFDYIDLYLLGSADSKYIRVPATQTAVDIQQQNLSDDASSNFLRLWEMRVSISGSTVSITKSIAWAWDDPNNSNPTVTANAQNGVPITRIDGVKVASDTPAEVTDIRVGADGTTYNSAGAAVRGQISDLKEEISHAVFTEFSADITVEANKMVDISNGTIISFAGTYAVSNVPVRGGTKVKISLQSVVSGGIRGIAFYNSSKTYINFIYIPYESGVLEYEFDVPYKASYIAFTSFDGKFTVSSKNAPDQLYKECDTSSYEYGYFDASEKKIYYGGTSYRLYSSPVIGGESFHISPYFTHSSVGFGFFEDGRCIESHKYDGNTSSEYVVTVPSDANEVIFSAYSARVPSATRVLTFDSATAINNEPNEPFSKIMNTPTFVTMFRRITCIGDSLTRGEFDTTTIVEYRGNNRPEFSWVAQMQKMTGVECVNLGIGSHSASRETDACWLVTALDTTRGQSYPFPVTDFTERLGDAYIIALGTNDIGRLGSFTGDVSTDIKSDYTQNAITSVGGYAEIIQRILELQPKAKIFCVTIPKTRNSASERAVANPKIKAIAKHFGCYVIDLETYGEDSTGEFATYYKNASHTNALGHNLRAREYISYIDWIIENNLDEFRNVQFIGEETTWEP